MATIPSFVIPEGNLRLQLHFSLVIPEGNLRLQLFFVCDLCVLP